MSGITVAIILMLMDHVGVPGLQNPLERRIRVVISALKLMAFDDSTCELAPDSNMSKVE